MNQAIQEKFKQDTYSLCFRMTAAYNQTQLSSQDEKALNNCLDLFERGKRKCIRSFINFIRKE